MNQLAREKIKEYGVFKLAAFLSDDLKKVSAQQVSQWATDNKGTSRPMPVEHVKASCGELGLEVWDLYPNGWEKIWPELVQAPATALHPMDGMGTAV
jgi:hypothetical protein